MDVLYCAMETKDEREIYLKKWRYLGHSLVQQNLVNKGINVKPVGLFNNRKKFL